MTELNPVARHSHRVGEGPLWHPDEELVYWTDIPSGQLFSYDPSTAESRQCLKLDTTLGGFTLQADGSLLLCLGEGAVATWDGSDLQHVIDAIPDEQDSRFNDVIAGPEGRVYGGTMPTEEKLGRLYRIGTDGSYECVDDNRYAIPNGMGFSPDRDVFYITESDARRIYEFDYDKRTGGLSNRRSLVAVPEGEGVPDGMTVDESGYIWSARWGGGRVVRYAPDGREVDHVEVSVPKASSVTFGGAEYDTLYVTTASGTDGEDDPPAGSLFAGDVGVNGVPEFRSRIGIR